MGTQISIYRWLDKVNLLYPYSGYYSALKRKLILILAMWMNLKDFMYAK
jgi:hypothetical protein